jgi:hypothetical protein
MRNGPLNMSRRHERPGNPDLLLSGIIVALVICAVFLIWGFVYAPRMELQSIAQGPGASGLMSNQDSDQSSSAKSDTIPP